MGTIVASHTLPDRISGTMARADALVFVDGSNPRPSIVAAGTFPGRSIRPLTDLLDAVDCAIRDVFLPFTRDIHCGLRETLLARPEPPQRRRARTRGPGHVEPSTTVAIRYWF